MVLISRNSEWTTSAGTNPNPNPNPNPTLTLTLTLSHIIESIPIGDTLFNPSQPNWTTSELSLT